MCLKFELLQFHFFFKGTIFSKLGVIRPNLTNWMSLVLSHMKMSALYIIIPHLVYGSFHQVGAQLVTVSIVTSVNVPSIILDYKCTSQLFFK